MCSIEERLEREGKIPTYYRRYVDDTLTVLPNKTVADNFLAILNDCHASINFTMETENNCMLPFLGVQLLNKSTHIETKVYVKPTNTGLLLQYNSHVDYRYKRSLIKTMLDRAFRLSSNWLFFSEECDRLKLLFSCLEYPCSLINSTITRFFALKASGSSVTSVSRLASPEKSDPIRIVVPFKDQSSANIVRDQLNNLRRKIHVNVQPIFISNKIEQVLKSRECKTKDCEPTVPSLSI